jgi:class 3 adenylate cyclase/CheY-like chemotaxis protein
VSDPHPAEAQTLTLLFSDVEGSTGIADRHGQAGTEALVRHHDIVREVAEAHDGRLFERVGDAAYAVFSDAPQALAAALEIHRRLAETDWGPIGRLRVRIALDSGPLEERDGRFYGRPLFRCARIQSLAHGGETLVSDSTADLVEPTLPAGMRFRDLGAQRLRGLAETERVWGIVRAPGARQAPIGDAIKVLLVDDYEVVRRGLRGFLELVPEIEIVGDASNGEEAVEAAFRYEPDVVLMDLVMPKMDGPAAIAAIRERQPHIAVVALTSFAEPERIGRALEAGAVGSLMKDADAEDVVAAVRAAYVVRHPGEGGG